MTKAQKKYRGMGRVEFLACFPEIQAMHKNGWSPQMLYDLLREKKKITISKSQFCRYLAENGLVRKRKKGVRKNKNAMEKTTVPAVRQKPRALPATAPTMVEPLAVREAESGDAKDFSGDVSDEKKKRMTGEE